MGKICLHDRVYHRGFAVIFCVLLTAFSTMALASAAAEKTQWQRLAPGIDYTSIPVKQAFADGKIHAFQVDLQENTLSVDLAKNYTEQSLYIRNFAELNGSLIAINGGFFDPEKQPLGLRINNHQTAQPIRNISWWGVFYVKSGKPFISSQNEFRSNKHISMALQAGPRIITNKRIPNLSGGAHQRSALCINASQNVLLIVTERALMTTTELATALVKTEANGGLGCIDALNLDGGSSSQLYAQINEFQLYLSNLASVSDAIVVKQRQALRKPTI